jgi:hypothetical protein
MVTRGFIPLAQRWVVERSPGLTASGAYVMNYERQVASQIAWVLVTNLIMSLQRATSP